MSSWLCFCHASCLSILGCKHLLQGFSLELSLIISPFPCLDGPSLSSSHLLAARASLLAFFSLSRCRGSWRPALYIQSTPFSVPIDYKSIQGFSLSASAQTSSSMRSGNTLLQHPSPPWPYYSSSKTIFKISVGYYFIRDFSKLYDLFLSFSPL